MEKEFTQSTGVHDTPHTATTDSATPLLTGITVCFGDQRPSDKDYIKIDVDLNKNAGGEHIYIYCKRSLTGVPITGILFIKGYSANIQPPAGYQKIDRNLNAGAGGKYIYLCYTTYLIWIASSFLLAMTEFANLVILIPYGVGVV